ncbi:hypothetical protein CEUSTIGMA_g135.t1 [Chlamydomonas eustigma]|uniref:Uncharacterized protein n=1 Tax=Chlamydomonas eustigma TaxID=1157962 RepID=A0A250WPQ6_9CHLO|nr:hypothetical protein CEUSTIGMA_g135.t1 [Chlamydomonas eustigma]|eukprot:GAX72679.1 hypothetical protein CEUSTIGMA_g135.t1 [Chlamydomonas eustigma]
MLSISRRNFHYRRSLEDASKASSYAILNLWFCRSVRACAKDKEDDSRLDWDSSWRAFQKRLQGQVESKTPGVRSQAPRLSPRLSPQQNRLRQQERLLLDFWTTEGFYKVGAVAATVLLLFCVIYAGPMPLDSRCTLPWC